MIQLCYDSEVTTTTVDVPEVMTSPELSRLTGVSVATICRWARKGYLPTIRKARGRTGVWMFPAEAYEEALRRHDEWLLQH